MMLILLLSHHAAPLKSPATRSTFSLHVTARIVRMNFFHSTPCKTQPEFIRQFTPGIVEVNEFDLDVGEECILVESHCTSPLVSCVGSVREEVVVDILNRLLQGDSVLLSCNSFLDSTLFSTSRSRIPVVDT